MKVYKIKYGADRDNNRYEYRTEYELEEKDVLIRIKDIYNKWKKEQKDYITIKIIENDEEIEIEVYIKEYEKEIFEQLLLDNNIDIDEKYELIQILLCDE